MEGKKSLTFDLFINMFKKITAYFQMMLIQLLKKHSVTYKKKFK